MVYVLALGAALLFGIGSVVQQRSASQAPPNFSLSLRLLLWLVRQPLWLVGVATAVLGNLLSGSALAIGSVALVQPLLVTRLLFALPLAAAWMRQRIPRRDLLAALAAALGLAAFIVAGRPQQLDDASPSGLTWGIAIALIAIPAIALVSVARTLSVARKAPLLGAGAGLLFGLQAGLMQTAVRAFTDSGLIAVLLSWSTYAVVVTAVGGTLLAQSAYEMAPLTASYPALAAVEPLAGIGIGVGVLSGSLRLSPVYLAVGVVGLAVMTGGIYLLATSSLVTGQLDVLDRKQEEGEALRTEEDIDREISRLGRDLASLGTSQSRHDVRLRRRIRAELARVDRDIDRLNRFQCAALPTRSPAGKGAAAGTGAAQQARRNELALLEAREREVAQRAERLRHQADDLRARVQAAVLAGATHAD